MVLEEGGSLNLAVLFSENFNVTGLQFEGHEGCYLTIEFLFLFLDSKVPFEELKGRIADSARL